MIEQSWNRVTVGVASIEEALEIWVGIFGMEIILKEEGDDPGLNKLWGLEAGSISCQALVATPGQSFGMLHLVQFNNPDRPVREGAKPTDFCPKNLDIYIDDLPERLDALKVKGLEFRNPNYSELTTPDGTLVREIHIHGHDQTNIVFLDIVGKSLPFSSKGFAGIGPLVTIVPDANSEKAFYKDVFSLSILHEYLLKGPEIEKMIGLPPGSGLDMNVLGNANQHLGQVEVIEYQGIDGTNLYPLTRPKALGTLMLSYLASDLSIVRKQLEERGIEVESHKNVQSKIGNSDAIRFTSPAGMQLEVHEQQ